MTRLPAPVALSRNPLPPSVVRWELWLALVAALLALAATLVIACAAFRDWRAAPAPDPSRLMFAVAGKGLESADAAAARAAESLATAPGVAGARILDPPGLGAVAGAASSNHDPPEAPARQILVTPRKPGASSVSALTARLRADGLAARAAGDAGGGLTAGAARAWAIGAGIVAVGLGGLVVGLLAALTRTSLREASAAVDLLRGLGAEEAVLGRWLIARIPPRALAATVVAIGLAVGLLLAAARLPASPALLRSVEGRDLIPVLIWLPIPALVATALTLGWLRRTARSWP